MSSCSRHKERGSRGLSCVRSTEREPSQQRLCALPHPAAAAVFLVRILGAGCPVRRLRLQTGRRALDRTSLCDREEGTCVADRCLLVWPLVCSSSVGVTRVCALLRPRPPHEHPSASASSHPRACACHPIVEWRRDIAAQRVGCGDTRGRGAIAAEHCAATAANDGNHDDQHAQGARGDECILLFSAVWLCSGVERGEFTSVVPCDGSGIIASRHAVLIQQQQRRRRRRSDRR